MTKEQAEKAIRKRWYVYDQKGERGRIISYCYGRTMKGEEFKPDRLYAYCWWERREDAEFSIGPYRTYWPLSDLHLYPPARPL